MLPASMRTQYLLDEPRRRTGAAVQAVLAREGQDRHERRRRLGLFAAVLLGAAAGTVGLWAAWHWAFAPAPMPGSATEAAVPEHQRSGPLANPWGAGAPVAGERAAEAASSSAAATASTVATSAPPARPDVSLAGPGAREAVRAALAQLRTSPSTGDFVKWALAGGEPAQLAAAWMAERQCRQVAQWRLMTEWRTRALHPGARGDAAAPLPAAGVHPLLRTLLARCGGQMPADSAIDAALAAAGFAATSDLAESTRRPLDLARAVSLGDPLLLASVIDAGSADELAAYVAQASPQRGPAETATDVLKAALWLASCRAGAGNAAGAPGTAGTAGAAPSRSPCAEHPALWQACTQQGLCDARDLHDLLLRTMPADQWHASERLAQALAPLIGR